MTIDAFPTMDYQVSARKYRPGTFQDLIGQPHVVQTLVNAITSNRIAHAFLFSGTRGVGKTTVARILAKALNCERGPIATPCDVCPSCLEIAQGTSVDVIEIDGASNTGVDDVREIRENVKFSPFRGHYRIYIIDEVHMLSNSAFNALLKTLEEPPAHVVFIFATTEIHKIPATILSRCQHYNFRRIPKGEIAQRLRHIADHEGITVEDRSLTAIARASEGSMRDALSILDQTVAFSGKTIHHSDLETLLGSVPREHVRGMITAIINQDSPAALGIVAQLLDQGHDIRAYCAELVEHVRNLLVAAVVPSTQTLRSLIEASPDDIDQVIADAQLFTTEQLQELFRICSQAEDALRSSAHPRYVLEMAVVRATRLLTGGTQPSMTVASSSPAQGSPPGRAGLRGAPSEARSSGQQPVSSAVIPLVQPSSGASREGQPSPAGSTPSSNSRPGSHSGDRSPEEKPLPALSGPSHPVESPLQLEWEQVLQRVASTHPSIGAFLEMGTLVTMEDDQWSFGYPQTASVARAIIEKEENLQLLGGICAEVAGRPIRLRVIELVHGHTAGPSLAQIRAVRERRERDALLERTRSHPLVQQALKLFGGELVDVRQAAPQKEVL